MIIVNKKILIILIILVVLGGFTTWFVYQYKQESDNIIRSSPNSEQDLNSTLTSTTSTSTLTLKTYRNDEWGFEFEYPKGWSFEINSFYSPFSKFNLQGNSSAKNYNPLLPVFLLNIVTPDFADKAIMSRRARAAIESDIVVDGISGKKFEYNTEYLAKISVDLPFDKHRIILATNKEHEDVFDQILSSFKFLSSSTTTSEIKIYNNEEY